MPVRQRKHPVLCHRGDVAGRSWLNNEENFAPFLRLINRKKFMQMAQPIKNFDAQSWNYGSRSNGPAPVCSAHQQVLSLQDNSNTIMFSLLSLLVEQICEEKHDAKRLFNYMRRKLQQYIQSENLRFHYDKPRSILLKNELHRVISETASKANIPISHDRLYDSTGYIHSLMKGDGVQRFYCPGLRESANYLSKNFTFMREIGRGGFGAVFCMRNKVDNIEYAVKEIDLKIDSTPLNDEHMDEDNEKIRNEVLILAKLDHPNIVRYHSTWTQHYWTYANTSLIEVQRSLSYEPVIACEQSDLLNDSCEEKGERLVIEELHGAAGGISGELVVPSLPKGDVYTSLDFVRAADQAVWSSEWGSESGEEEEHGSAKKDEKEVAIVVVNACPSSNETVNDEPISSVMDLVRHGRFGERSLSSPSKAVVRANSENAKREQLPAVRRTSLYIQMQLCDLSLKDWLSDRATSEPPLVVDRRLCLNIFEQAVRGVAYLHSEGLIHRDIKPANVLLLRKEKGTMQVKLADFGLSRYLPNAEGTVGRAEGSQEMSTKIGTAFYAAPEQRSGCRYGKEADMYSLGLILFELFRPCGTNSELLAVTAGLREDPVCCPEDFATEFPDVAVAVCKLLQRNPQLRPTADDLLGEDGLIGIEWTRNEIMNLRRKVASLTVQLASKDAEVSRLRSLLNFPNCDRSL